MCSAGFDDSSWENAVVRKAPEGRLTAHMSPVDRVMESLPPVKQNGSVKVITELISVRRYRAGYI